MENPAWDMLKPHIELLFGEHFALEIALYRLLAKLPEDEFNELLQTTDTVREAVESEHPLVVSAYQQVMDRFARFVPRARTDIPSLADHIRNLTEAVETIHGPIGKEYDSGPSGRPDD